MASVIGLSYFVFRTSYRFLFQSFGTVFEYDIRPYDTRPTNVGFRKAIPHISDEKENKGVVYKGFYLRFIIFLKDLGVILGMVVHPLPEWSQQYPLLMDEKIEELVRSVRLKDSVEIFWPLVQRATQLGRKSRSTLALSYVHWQGYPEDERYQRLLRGLAAVEVLHSASCVLDDIIDGDTVRRGVPVFHAREGLPQAQLFILEAVALPLYLGDPPITNEITNATRLMLQGEACDSFEFNELVSRLKPPVDLLELYSRKTYPSFEGAHRLIGIVYGSDERTIDSLGTYGGYLGRFYQYANDFHDTFSIPCEVRGSLEEPVRVTLSMPLLVALTTTGEYRSSIGKTVTRKELGGLFEKMKLEGVAESAAQLLDETRRQVLSAYPGTPPQDLQQFLDIVGSSQFWSYAYAPHKE